PFLAVLATVVLLTELPAVASARAPDSTDAPGFSWRGRPLPECSSFLITELGIHYLLNPGPTGEREQLYFVTEDLGYMRNLNERSALGGLLHLGGNSDRKALGPAVRYRRWLHKAAAADVTVGLDVAGLFNSGGRF